MKRLGFILWGFSALLAPSALAHPDSPLEMETSGLDPVFMMGGYPGPFVSVGVPPDNTAFPTTRALWRAAPAAKKSRLKAYGFTDASYNYSSSQKSNIPESFDIVPNSPELQQAVFIVERLPDTAQQDHVSWGFQLANLYGIDYHWTTSQGIFSQQLLQQSHEYGYDPLQFYVQAYVPQVAKGMVLTLGRILSPPDIEAQFAINNFMFSHSIMYTFDTYTVTGLNSIIKLSREWTAMLGLHAGSDIAPWAPSAQPTGLALAQWTSGSRKDSVWGGIDAINNGEFNHNHDNLQQFNLTWSHSFSRRYLEETEAYYIYEYNADLGGTCFLGPATSLAGGGCGPLLPGYSWMFGATNYEELKLGGKTYLSVRNSYLEDERGMQTGFATSYSEDTIGITHRFSQTLIARPELRYDRAWTGSVTPFDDGTRRAQFTAALDVIQRF